MNEGVRILTRRELYDLVWSKPVQTAAEELGLSDRGLANICSRHSVPSPGRGYWARVAAGQSFKLPPLRTMKNAALERIEIRSSVARFPAATREILQKTRRERKSAKEDKAFIPRASVQIPHRAIAATAKHLRKAKPDRFGQISAIGPGLCGVAVHIDRVERAVSFVDALAEALEAHELRLEPNENCMKIAVGQDVLTFTLTERYRRPKHVPTEAEQELYRQQQARREKASRLNNWDLYRTLPYREPWPEYDTIYTGQLAIEISLWGVGPRKTWADGKTQTIESMFEKIVDGLKIALVHKKAERERREESARRQAEFSRRCELAKKRDQREEKRISYLKELVRLQLEAADIRKWLSTLPVSAAEETDTDLGRMLRWAETRAEHLEAKTTVEAASVQLDGKSLFPEFDELADPLGDPRTWLASRST
jgi:hypothetical protein